MQKLLAKKKTLPRYYDRPHRGVGNRTPHEAFLSFATVLKNEALTV
jgi:hypothetical protein